MFRRITAAAAIIALGLSISMMATARSAHAQDDNQQNEGMTFVPE